MDVSFLTPESRRRKESAIRALLKLLNDDSEFISLGGGLPNPSLFPIAGMSLRLKDGTVIEIAEDDVQRSLQYSQTPGIAPLLERLWRVQVSEHRLSPAQCAPGRLSLSVGTGCQDLFTKAFEALVNEHRTVLVEDPTYPGALSFLEPLGCGICPVATDGDGLVPEALRAVLDNWDVESQGARPHVLYLIPNGGNPSGATIPPARREAILEIARDPKNDLIIFEDDPYYFLTFGEDSTAGEGGSCSSKAARAALPSFLSLDTDPVGRVIRFDSFSKVVSSGIRVGYCTGPSELVRRINLKTASTSLQPSGVSQAVMLSLLRHWGFGDSDSPDSLGRFEGHAEEVASFYKRQLGAFMESAKRHLDGLVEFTPPRAGMFVWMRIVGVEDSRPLIEGPARKKKVILLPGCYCTPVARVAGSLGDKCPETALPASSFVRAAFSLASHEEMDMALERLAMAIREARGE